MLVSGCDLYLILQVETDLVQSAFISPRGPDTDRSLYRMLLGLRWRVVSVFRLANLFSVTQLMSLRHRNIDVKYAKSQHLSLFS